MTLFFLLLISFSTNAQQLTGIWRGYFSSSTGMYREGFKEETYKYEIQLDQQANNSVKGVTYSYKSTVFYGKAELNGIYTPTSKSLIIKEIRLVDLKIGDKSEPCLMTCYLDYTKIGKLEVLEGSFISTNVKDKADCGSGKVYLERVPASDFKKEDFLLKTKPGKSAQTLSKLADKKTVTPKNAAKTPPVARPNPTVKNNVTKKVPAPRIPPVQAPVKKPAAKPTETTAKKSLPQKSTPSKTSPAVSPRPTDRVPEQLVKSKPAEAVPTPRQEEQEHKAPIPKVLIERENRLVRTITTSEENIQINIFDNGTIDNDTISLYHNNTLMISNAKLDIRPLTLKIKCSKTDNRHELVMVAENLGEIPPNSAMMVITAGKERYEVFLASDEQRNAKVVINYIPKE